MGTIFELVLNELRLALHLARSWIIFSVATLICVFLYILLELQHILRAAESASVGIMAPTYLAATLGPYFMALICLGIVLVAYDRRERDLRCRINEALDVVPASNVTVVIGWLLGLVLLFALPIVFFVIAIILYGWIAESAGLGYGNLIELHSVASFLLWDLVPNLAFFGSLTIFLATIIRSSVTVLALAFGCVLLIFWLFLRLPLEVSGVLLTTTGATLFPSEIAPRFMSAEMFVNRFSLLLFTVGFVVLTGCCWRRPLKNREYFTVVGLSSCILGVLIIGGSLFYQQLRYQEVQSWVRAHNALEMSTFPDVIQINGNVEIVPGRTMKLDLTVDLVSSAENTRDFVVLSLNPGYRVSNLWVGGKEVQDYRFDQGILRVPFVAQAGNAVPIRIKARGRPDARFAYLDAAVNTKDIAGTNARNLFAMGTESFIFHPKFVVLTAGSKWYPTSGAATGEDKLEVRPRDLYEVDLTVSVPETWLVAGPGHREMVSTRNEKRSTYRIAPDNPVPEFTLVSSNFESASTVVEGVEFEVLFSKHHQRRFHDLSNIERSLKTRISSFIVQLKQAGLVYPYELFSLVEVPSSLRVFGGGWNMDTIMGPPGMVLMRESSLPNTKVKIVGELMSDHNADLFGHSETQRLKGSSAGTDLSSYFNSNVFGEHPTIGFARNFVRNQTSPTGFSCRFLEHVIDEVVQRLIFDRSVFVEDRIGTNPGRAFIFEVALANAKRSVYDLFDVYQPPRKKSREELALLRYGTRSEVWNDLKQYSLGELTFDHAPLRSFRVVRLKSSALSRIMLELLGKRQTTSLLGHLVNTYKGMPYSYDDMITAAKEIDLNLEEILGDWLNVRGLPGFILAEPSIKRLPDSVWGKVYQASLVVHNAEIADGFATVSWLNERLSGGQREDTRRQSRAFLVRGKESVRLSVTSNLPAPIDIVYVEPYLSLNRGALRIDIPDLLDENAIEEKARPYVVETAWLPTESQEIVVDDVDANFEIVYDRPPRTTMPVISFLHDLLGTSVVEESDYGLPLYVSEHETSPPKQRWLRCTDSRAYGRYRHTYTFIHQGKKERPSYAKFSATLPNSGRWRLDYHMPIEHLDPNDRESHILLVQGKRTDWYERFPPGATDVAVFHGKKREAVTFEAQQADHGWNTLGEFDVDSTNTEVWISGTSDLKTIYADAIRWVPIDIRTGGE